MLSLDLTLEPGEGWPESAGEVIEALSRCGDQMLEKPLSELLAVEPAPELETLTFGRPA